MEQMDLKGIKEIETALLEHFARVCDQKGISYFLSNGTLLGAVKYGGFIPWDDDIDVLVPREDYDRLMAEYADSEQYMLLSPERNDRFAYPFAKLCDRSTVLEEVNYDNGVTLGVNMDIFPLDVWEPDFSAACRQMERNKKLTRALGFTRIRRYIPGATRTKLEVLIRRCALPLYKLVGAKRFRDAMIRTALRCRKAEPAVYRGCVLWPVYGKGEILPAEVFAGTVPVQFEGREYPAPAGYDRYLRSLYGDYEKDPPAEKQVSHHDFVVTMGKTER